MVEENENITICYDCDEEINTNEDNYYETCDGNIICERCYNNNYFTCEDCGEVYNYDYSHYVRGGDRYVCESCLSNYSYCDNCGEYYDEDYVSYCGERDEYLCDDCYSRIRQENDRYIIHDYHDRDIPITYLYEEEDLENNSLYPNENTEHIAEYLLKFGMEIEVENARNTISNDEMARMIRERFPWLKLVFEEDGSLSNGFEIITQPMTITFIRKHKEDFKELCKMLSDNGFQSHNGGRCGQHIHFSRVYFGDNDDKYVGKMLTFFEKYKKELVKFSRRDSVRWCSWVSDNAGYDSQYYKSSKILCDYAKSNTGHGVAINLQHSNTIEVRIFRGTLKYETLMSNFEFVNSLVHIVKELPTRRINLDKVINYEGNEFLQDYCLSKEIFNSEYLSDETSNIFRVLQAQKDKYDKVKVDVKNSIEGAISEMVDLTKSLVANMDEYNKENEEKIKTLLNTTRKLQELITNNIDFVNGTTLRVDDRRVEDNYRDLIRYGVNNNFSAVIQYYENIKDYIPNNDYTLELRNKMSEELNKLKQEYAITSEI